jgi:uncharacterized protein (TIGR00288 family)
MHSPFTRAPHVGGATAHVADVAHNAALLIDFDNVTMGMRSDMSKELKNLLDSDIIKGKVAVQRAYADWRRYPQYIVPLSEASIDLIFAPAYGSSKKNATDIRMAIDALELIFIRPEIGTFILLTGDSDFSSLVLKLKEYGKYVIGVGLQESSSDILVQNCDEYYSYTSLTGLKKTSEADRVEFDPWVLVQKAVERMLERGDVMRSDRLKQVMIELDPSFEERKFGFAKFSKFLAEAAGKGLVQLHKMDNGQYEVAPGGKGGRRGGKRTRRSTRGRSSERAPRDDAAAEAQETGSDEGEGSPLDHAYQVLKDAMSQLAENGRPRVRDSDVKRRILQIHSSFDEAELGFGKFSKFLRQAHDDRVIHLERLESGQYEVSLPGAPRREERGKRKRGDRGRGEGGRKSRDGSDRRGKRRNGESKAEAQAGEGLETTAEDRDRSRESDSRQQTTAGVKDGKEEAAAPSPGRDARKLTPRRQRTRQGAPDEPPPIMEGQVVQVSKLSDVGATSGELEDLGLPSDTGAIIRYLAHRYKGVGEKTAETLVDELGTDVFDVMHRHPERISEIVPAGRAERVLEAWRADYERRTSADA